jgi:hypothetical protein
MYKIDLTATNVVVSVREELEQQLDVRVDDAGAIFIRAQEGYVRVYNARGEQVSVADLRSADATGYRKIASDLASGSYVVAYQSLAGGMQLARTVIIYR